MVEEERIAEKKRKQYERDKRYRLKHPEKIAARLKAWRTANPEKAAALQKQWYEAHKEDHAAKGRAWAKANKEKLAVSVRKSKLRKHYGITEELTVEHCDICGTTDFSKGSGGRYHVDHDHVTGQVRGFLCQNCNHLLGNCKDSPEILAIAIEYLKNPPYQAGKSAGPEMG